MKPIKVRINRESTLHPLYMSNMDISKALFGDTRKWSTVAITEFRGLVACSGVFKQSNAIVSNILRKLPPYAKVRNHPEVESAKAKLANEATKLAQTFKADYPEYFL